MANLHRQARVAKALCLASFPAALLAHLALTDIRHGEADLTLEWNALRLSAMIIGVAVVASLRALHSVLEAMVSPDWESHRISKQTM
jgi:hypothetical protein